MSNEKRYDFKGKLGEGGRGSVYEAYDRQLKRKVAIKRLHPGDDIDAGEAYEMVLKESHALSAINSPNIVRIYDVGQDEEGPYAVMELLNGKTLEETVARAPLLEKDFIPVAEQALEALVAAHSAKLLHSDIKPANLVLTWLPSGRIMVKLLDFGLAKFTSASDPDDSASTGSVVGSIYFMSPEQFDHQPLDERTDLYSLGCVFYFALAGDYPFRGDNATEVMASHITGNCVDLKVERPDLPPALCDWVMGFMALEPEGRPESAHAALEELGRLRKQLLSQTSAVSTHTGSVNLATGPVTATAGGETEVPAFLRRSLAGKRGGSSGPAKPGGLNTGTGMPKWFFPTVGVLVVVILGLGVLLAVRLRSSDDPPPAPLKTAPPAVVPGAQSDSPPKRQPQQTPRPPQPDPPKRPAPKADDLVGQFFYQRDKNQDGTLTYNEYLPTFDKAIRDAERKTFNSFDSNKNKVLELKEVRGKGAAMAQFLGRDENNDLRLDLKEWLTFRPSNEVGPQTQTFNKKDVNKDGFLSLEEYRKPGGK